MKFVERTLKLIVIIKITMTMTAKSKHTVQISDLTDRTREIAAAALDEAAATDNPQSFPAATFAELSKAGIMQAVFPCRYGGRGLGIENRTTFELLTLLKTLGNGNLVVGRIYEGHFNAAQLICEYGTETQIARFAADAIERNHIFGVWNTEAGDGVKIESLGNGKFRLEGAKTFASGTGFVNRPIITGRTVDGGWQMFVVPMESVNVKIDDSWWKPLGMQASRSYRVDLTNVEITANELLGAPDDYYRQPFFGGGAIRFAAVQLGAAEILFDLTRQFLRELGRTDDPFQQMRLGEMAIAIEIGSALLEKAARIFDDYSSAGNAANINIVLNYAGIFRTAIEQICQNTMIAAERSIGSRGLLKPYHFERVIRDLKMYLRQAAPDATLAAIGKFALENERPKHLLRHIGNE